MMTSYSPGILCFNFFLKSSRIEDWEGDASYILFFFLCHIRRITFFIWYVVAVGTIDYRLLLLCLSLPESAEQFFRMKLYHQYYS